MAKNNLQSIIFLFFILVKLLNSLPHDICFEKFDDRDCKQPPKQVFYYYQKGSRCETKMWRGCPTLNKFDDEFACSNLCVGKLWGERSGEIDTCQGTLNQANCGKDPQEVYTYKDENCVKGHWYGCETLNKFDDEETCVKTCVSSDGWVEKLDAYELDELEEIESILDEVLEHQPLKGPEPEPLPDPSSSSYESFHQNRSRVVGSIEEVVNL